MLVYMQSFENALFHTPSASHGLAGGNETEGPGDFYRPPRSAFLRGRRYGCGCWVGHTRASPSLPIVFGPLGPLTLTSLTLSLFSLAHSLVASL
jgi:hypothetical protein